MNSPEEQESDGNDLMSEEDGDVALRPGPNADDLADIEKYISSEVRARYDVYSYRHAAAILANSYPKELKEIEQTLLDFRITVREIAKPTFPAPIRIPQLRWWKSEIEAWIHKQPQQRRGGG